MPDAASRRLERLWSVTFLRSGPLLLVPIAAMVALGILRARNETWRLLHDPSHAGAIDLRLRMIDVHAWFQGERVYGHIATAVYPPASYALLWPIFGWLDATATRWWFLALVTVALAWLTLLVGKRVTHLALGERLMVLLIPLTTYSTWATIGNGQLTLFLLTPVLAAIPVLAGPHQRGRLVDLLCVAGLIFSMAKPQSSVPFFCLAMWRLRGVYFMSAAGVGYGLITLAAAAFQQDTLPILLGEWQASVRSLAGIEAGPGSYANIHAWLVSFGLQRWAFPASVLALAAFAAWCYRNQQAPIWAQLGAAGLVTRFWSYHRVYDDLLALPALVAVFLCAKEAPGPKRTAAEMLFWVGLVGAMGPARLHADPQWAGFWGAAQTTIWGLLLAYLLWVATPMRPGRSGYDAGPQPS